MGGVRLFGAEAQESAFSQAAQLLLLYPRRSEPLSQTDHGRPSTAQSSHLPFTPEVARIHPATHPPSPAHPHLLFQDQQHKTDASSLCALTIPIRFE